jgi:hypothetical protein
MRGRQVEQPEGVISRGRAVSRRAVLRTGALGVAATGAVAAFPGLLPELASDAPEAAGDASGAAAELAPGAAADLEGPVVAHIRDAASGEMSLYIGEREVTYRNPALVNQILRAAL